MDIEVDNGFKWMEVCSISRRTDFPQKFVSQSKGVTREHDVLVLEIAIGLDRCLHNWAIAEQRV
jgi:glycyl-tRNA synthetase